MAWRPLHLVAWNALHAVRTVAADSSTVATISVRRKLTPGRATPFDTSDPCVEDAASSFGDVMSLTCRHWWRARSIGWAEVVEVPHCRSSVGTGVMRRFVAPETDRGHGRDGSPLPRERATGGRPRDS